MASRPSSQLAGPRDGDLSTPDPSVLVMRLPEDKQNAGTKNFQHAVKSYEEFAAAFAEDLDNNSEGYAKGLVTLIQSVMLCDGLAQPPLDLATRIQAGITTPDATGAADPYFTRLLRSLSFKHSTGVDVRFFFGAKRPTVKQLLQQVAFGMLAGCDSRCEFPLSRPMVIDFLEDAFGCISSKADEKLYGRTLNELEAELVMLQFGIMLVLCRLYRQEFEKDRVGGMKYVIRHAEAARIMEVVCPKLYQGHAEVAWNDITKMLHGIQFVTAEAWANARNSAQKAVRLAAAAQNDFALAASLYDLAFLLAVGPPEETFDLGEVKKMLFDVDQIEQRLELWGMRDRLHFQSATRKYLLALKGEWDKTRAAAATATQSKKKGASGKKGKDAAQTSASAPLLKSAWPVTDWRCFDQRNQGYYTWLEPPNQEDDAKCVGCDIPLVRVHRCDTCKLAGFCSSICAAAHMDRHSGDCSPAPKPWLKPPGARPPPALPELGEEGYMGFIPWRVVRYVLFALASYAVYWLLEALDGIRRENNLTGWMSMLHAFALLLFSWFKRVGYVHDAPGAYDAETAPPSQDICGADGIECSTGEFEGFQD